MDPGHLHTDSDPKAYSADREEEPVDPGSQPDDTTEESENYPQKLFPVEEASQCTENGKPVLQCTEETLEPRLVVYGTRSAWSTGNGHSQSHTERQVDEGIDQQAESLFFLTLLLFTLLRN